MQGKDKKWVGSCMLTQIGMSTYVIVRQDAEVGCREVAAKQIKRAHELGAQSIWLTVDQAVVSVLPDMGPFAETELAGQETQTAIWGC
jgi:hypothetical protein